MDSENYIITKNDSTAKVLRVCSQLETLGTKYIDRQ